MADDEQFSLCWNNFQSNLSAGFHESLCRGDLVDVTLAAEGQFVKAHRLVLSVCSPYFRKMFTQMPANQHAFVFLKDVSHTALKDLIQFMYCGEVNVKQEALPAFISTAEALQIKGLTDSDPSNTQSPEEQAPPTPQQISPPRIRQRTSNTRSYKIETVDDSGDDKPTTQIVIQTQAAPSSQSTISQQSIQHHPTQQIAATVSAPTATVVSHKRPAQRSLGSTQAPHIKRTKSTTTTIDPLDSTETIASTATTTTTTQQITIQAPIVSDAKDAHETETEYIDLPIELPTKAEPDYAEESADVESADNDGAYVEDDSYGDLRYDESYFENDDANATANAAATSVSGAAAASGSTSASTSKVVVKQQNASYSDSSYVDGGDQSNNDAQGAQRQSVRKPDVEVLRKRGRPKLVNPQPPEKLMDKIRAAVANSHGLPTVYASTTKGGMKLIYEGHHFRYSFRKGQFSIFQCCYKENKEECKVRVVSDQKRVYPLDGEHVHFMQATDKSVTAVMFEPMESNVDVASPRNSSPEKHSPASQRQSVTVIQGGRKATDGVRILNVGVSRGAKQMTRQRDQEAEDVEARSSEVDSNDLRDQIKKRLQKALMGKKK